MVILLSHLMKIQPCKHCASMKFSIEFREIPISRMLFYPFTLGGETWQEVPLALGTNSTAEHSGSEIADSSSVVLGGSRISHNSTAGVGSDTKKEGAILLGDSSVLLGFARALQEGGRTIGVGYHVNQGSNISKIDGRATKESGSEILQQTLATPRQRATFLD